MTPKCKRHGIVALLIMMCGSSAAQPTAETTWREVVHPTGIAVGPAAAYQFNLHEWLDEDITFTTAEDICPRTTSPILST
jgi:hypothetical protein